MFEKIENFNNAVEFLLNFFFFYTLESLRISDWKIISHKIKQLHHLLKTIRMYAWSRYLQSSYLSGQHARSPSFFFLRIKTLVDIEKPSSYASGSL